MFKKQRIQLGVGYVDKYTILEIKWLFSIYVHVWNTIEQDRFHTHAFNAWVFLIKGRYWEEVINNWGTPYGYDVKRGIRYIPREYNHRILKSEPNSVSVAFAGPWEKTWTETFMNGTIRTLSLGRKQYDKGGIYRHSNRNDR